MIEHVRRELEPLFPLKITKASFTDPTLILAGDEWSFSSGSAWRITKGGVLAFGWSDPAAGDAIRDLSGNSIVAVAPQSALLAGDPAFELSDGAWLEIFSDHPTDPWSLRLPGLTFVGSPSDPTQVG